jgi:DNA-binding NtrC family response regulator
MTGVVTQTRRITEVTKPHEGVVLKVPDKTQILIICDNDPDTEQLKGVLQEAGMISKAVDTITSGCESAKSGRFQVVFCTPLLDDGSWRGLIDVASEFNLSFEIILLARTFDLNQWGDALQVGAFDVLDVLCDLPKAADAAKSALGTAYLKRYRSRPERVQVKRANLKTAPA